MAGAAPAAEGTPRRRWPLTFLTATHWRAAVLLGLVTSTYSTIVSTLAASRLGRDAPVDWMIVAAIPLRDPILQIHPTPVGIVGGILFHQWADFSWAVVFFGVLGHWTGRLKPQTIALLAAPWALSTSSLEWLFLVPILPFLQPIFTLEQVYWLGFFVHLSSAAMYPLFPWMRDRVEGHGPSPHRRFAAAWASGAGVIAVLLGVLAIMGSRGHELAWRGPTPAYDQSYMRQMAAHHAQGVVLAELGAARASDPHLRALARMMAAAQQAEIKVLRGWWLSWFSRPLPPPSPVEEMTMPGMLTDGEIDQLRQTRGPAFDPLFVALMSRHHRGAIAMSNAKLAEAGDLRVKIMAHAIRHEQTGEIALMHGAKPSLAVLRIALSSLLSPPDRVAQLSSSAQAICVTPVIPSGKRSPQQGSPPRP
jgi:uncharacterized protein (DUF305 family)